MNARQHDTLSHLSDMKLNPWEQVQREMQFLLEELCIELGFCLPPDDQERIVATEMWDADSFVAEVFRCEKMNPDEFRQLRREVGRKFEDHFGEAT